ncbi:hypothetical protein OAA91_01670 [Fibrobacterales bacterium]|nr:hypothetical protein [Fibrobacterales bacterium]
MNKSKTNPSRKNPDLASVALKKYEELSDSLYDDLAEYKLQSLKSPKKYLLINHAAELSETQKELMGEFITKLCNNSNLDQELLNQANELSQSPAIWFGNDKETIINAFSESEKWDRLEDRNISEDQYEVYPMADGILYLLMEW